MSDKTIEFIWKTVVGGVVIVVLAFILVNYGTDIWMAKNDYCYTSVERKNSNPTWEWEKCKGSTGTIMILGPDGSPLMQEPWTDPKGTPLPAPSDNPTFEGGVNKHAL